MAAPARTGWIVCVRGLAAVVGWRIFAWENGDG